MHFLLLIFAFVATAVAAEKKNVVLFVCDDLGFQLGCYGDKVARTPSIDALAASGVRFTNAHATTASCSPSRSVILSGLHNHTNGQYGLQHSTHHFQSHNGVLSLPVLLARGGYRTGRVGKYHVAPEEVFHFDQEFPGNHRNGVAMANNCREFLAAADERPFFLYFCTADPHRSAPLKDPLAPNPFGNDGTYAGVTEQHFKPEEVPVPPWLPDTPECRAELAEYYQSIARVDAGLGRLIALLKETGHADDTLILFTSDNGPPWPGAKTTTYQPGLNLPLIVKAPNMKHPGTASDALISWVDLTPTILEWCGVQAPAESAPIMSAGEGGKGGRAPKPRSYAFHGRSFSGIWDEEKPADRGPIFASHTFHEVTMYYPVRSIRTTRYKLSLNLAHELSFPFASDLFESSTWQSTLKSGATKYGQRTVETYLHRPKYELYDLEKDPGELNNLATDPVHKEVFDDLSAQLVKWQKQTGDPWLIKYEHE